MVIDHRFNYEDDPDLVEGLQACIERYGELTDNELLTELNFLPRLIARDLRCLEIVENQTRDMFVPVEVSLSERTDDWLAERRDAIKQEVSQLKRQDEALKAERDAIDEELVARFKERGTSGTRAARFTISMKSDDSYPVCSDRTAFENYLLETKKLHLLQKRLSLSAMQEELAILNEERKAYISRMEEANDIVDEACQIYRELHSHEALSDVEQTIDQMVSDKTIVNSVKQELQDRCVIPGIELVQKLTINQVKRSS